MKEKIKNHFKGNYKQFFEKYLKNIKQIGGDEFKSICPFHDEKNASFNFNSQTGQYFCHGCGKKGDFLHFYGKINGLDTRRDFGKILKGISDDFGITWEQKKSRIAKTYDYTDSDNNLLFQVCRMDPKDFRQRRPDGNGGWIWNLKGIKPVLYQLSEVLRDDEVVIVEGEKDAGNLLNIGFTATTCPMGAKKWRDEYNESLKGRNVVLIPDNDNEGREHMARIGSSLNGCAASLKWLELPDLPSKGDVSDFIATFNDKEQAAERLSILIENAKPYDPPKKVTIEDVVLNLKDFNTIELPIKRKILNPWLSEQSIGLISGWRGVGKSWFAISLLDAVSKGESFGPWETENSVPCLYLDGEMPAQDVKERFTALNHEGDLINSLYIYCDAYANHLGLSKANLLSEKWRAAIKRILVTRKIKLWAVDNLASLAGGIDENSKKDWDPINAWLLELRFAGISTIMLHHTNKEGGQRGTSAREDNIDISIMLKQPVNYVPEDGAFFVAKFSKARVSTSDLPLIADIQFKLEQDESGQLVWTWGNVKKETKIEVLKMIDEGAKTNEITDVLGITKGYVSQIKNRAIKAGELTSAGKLTPDGYSLVFNE